MDLFGMKKRKKEYNSYQLYKALEYCKENGLEDVLITCNKENMASAKSIQKYCDILENEIFDENKNEIVQRYWINLSKVLRKREKLTQKEKNNFLFLIYCFFICIS